MAGISFSTAEFVRKLRAGEFASAPLAATGLVKTSEEEDGLLFAHGSDCTNWISIPTRLIDRVEFLQVVPCKDHSHPLVTLVFSIPESPEAQVFAGLAKLTSSASPNPQPIRSVPVFSAPLAAHPLQPHAFFTSFDVPNPSAHALLQDNIICPDGQKKVWLGDHWGCVPSIG